MAAKVDVDSPNRVFGITIAQSNPSVWYCRCRVPHAKHRLAHQYADEDCVTCKLKRPNNCHL